MDTFDLKRFINENNLGAYSKLPSSSNINEITPAQQKYADKAASRPSKPKKTQFRKDIEGAKRMIDSGKSQQEVVKRFGIEAYNAVNAENEYLEERKIEVNEPSQLKDLKNQIEKYYSRKLEPSQINTMVGKDDKIANLLSKYKKLSKDVSETTKGNIVSEDLEETSGLEFKVGDKVKYLGHPGVITKAGTDIMDRPHYSVSYNKGTGDTKATNIYNKGGVIKKAISETKTDYDFSEQELIRVLRQLKTGAATEVDMIRAFTKALGRELTDDEIRGHKVDPSRVGKASMEEKKVEVDDETEFKITLSHLLDKHVK